MARRYDESTVELYVPPGNDDKRPPEPKTDPPGSNSTSPERSMRGSATRAAFSMCEPVGHGALEDAISEPTTRLVLLAQDRHEPAQRIALVEPREDEFLFELLMVVLYEASRDGGRCVKDLGRHVLPDLQLPQAFLVDQQDAIQHAMLPHEVLR